MYRSDYLIRIGQIRAKLQKIAIDDDILRKRLEDVGKEQMDIANKKHNSQPLLKEVPFGGKNSRDKYEDFSRMSVENNAGIDGKKIRPKTPIQTDRNRIITAKKKARVYNLDNIDKRGVAERHSGFDADEENERNRERNFRNTQRSIETGGT